MLPEEAMEAGAVALEGVGLADEAEQPVGEAQTEAEVAADGSWLGKLAKRVTGAEPVIQPEAQRCGDGHFWTPRGVRNSDAYSEALSWARRKRAVWSDSSGCGDASATSPEEKWEGRTFGVNSDLLIKDGVLLKNGNKKAVGRWVNETTFACPNPWGDKRGMWSAQFDEEGALTGHYRGPTFGYNNVEAEFVGSDFIPVASDKLNGGGTRVIGPGVVEAPGWCGHGSRFTYSAKKDVWEEYCMKEGKVTNVWKRTPRRSLPAVKPIDQPYSPPSGLVAWFRGEDFDGLRWPDARDAPLICGPEICDAICMKRQILRFGRVTSGEARREVAAGHGARGPVAAAVGSTGTSFAFGKVVPPNFTIASVTRYTSPGGAKQGRILQGLKKDWIHGNVQRMTGCASYGNGWYAKHKCENSHTTDWVITIGQNNVIGGRSIVRCNGIDGSMRNHHGGEGDVALVINQGECPKENSDWAVAELMTWDRHLTRAEIEGVEAYLVARLDDPAGLAIEEKEPATLAKRATCVLSGLFWLPVTVMIIWPLKCIGWFCVKLDLWACIVSFFTEGGWKGGVTKDPYGRGGYSSSTTNYGYSGNSIHTTSGGDFAWQ